MGVDSKSAFLLMAEAAKRPFGGSVLQLGRQDVLVSWQQLNKFSRRLAFRREAPLADQPTFVSDANFFEYLGFEEVHSVDNSAFEGADFVFDMNEKQVPETMKERFDMIFDGGTMEHVFDGPQFLRNTFAMLKVGGRMIHFSPTFNHVNHGFYAYCPTLFLDYYRANNFNMHRLLLVKDSLRGAYVCDCLNEHVYARVDRLGGFHGAYYTFAIATKTQDSRSDVIPQQGMYVALWQGGAQPRFKGHQLLKNLSRKNVAYSRVLHFLRRRFLNSWIYRWYCNRAVKWTKLP